MNFNEPEILSSHLVAICLKGVDGKQVLGSILRWTRQVRQFSGLAKVDLVGFYAANCSVMTVIG